MLEIVNLQQELDENVIAPEVYIDSIHIDNEKVRVFFHLEDPDNKWTQNQYLLENLFVYITYDQQNYVEKLISLKQKTNNNLNYISSHIDFILNSPNSKILAYTGNDSIRSISTDERVLQDDRPVQPAIGSTTYKYINKIIDLRLLDINFNLKPEEVSTSTGKYDNTIFVSDTTIKKSNIGYIFDLENYLNNNSATYRTLKNYNNYKKIILERSYIDQANILFLKKNITLKGQEYQKINSPINIIRLSDNEYKYLLTLTDDNDNNLNINKYSLRVYFEVKDYSHFFFKNNITDILASSKQYVSYYLSRLQSIFDNKTIENPYNFFFENIFEQEQKTLEKVIEDLSEIYSFYSQKDKTLYYSLLLSIFHPLTTDIELLNNLLNNIELIESSTRNFLETIESVNSPGRSFVTKDKLTFLKDFNSSLTTQVLDYDYEYNTGFEVISSDVFDIRKEEKYNGFKVITADQKYARKILEDGKSLGVSREPQGNQNTGSSTVFPRTTATYVSGRNYNQASRLQNNQTASAGVATQEYYSISSIDIKGNSAYLLDNIFNADMQVFNSIFLNLKQYNRGEESYRTPEAYYFDVLNSSVNVTNLSDGVNASVNNLQKTVLFDPNLDSQQQSLQFIVETGVESLYYSLDQTRFLEVPRDIKNINVMLTGISSSTNETLLEDVKNYPQLKPKAIILYNNYFQDIEIYSGENYALYLLNSAIVNNIFNKKLRHFNKFYVVERKKNIPWKLEQPKSDFINELSYNIPSKYLNRVTSEAQISLKIDEL